MAAIRHQINIDAPLRKVWKALTTVEGVTSWWVDEARLDAQSGGRIVLVSEDDDGNPLEEVGIFVSVRPTRKIEIKWDNVGSTLTKGTTVTFQLARFREETRVSVVHTGAAILEDEELASTLHKDWKGALSALRTSLEGTANETS